jgi:hypothetical protein
MRRHAVPIAGASRTRQEKHIFMVPLDLRVNDTRVLNAVFLRGARGRTAFREPFCAGGLVASDTVRRWLRGHS